MNIGGLQITDKIIGSISKTAHQKDLVQDTRKFTEQPPVKAPPRKRLAFETSDDSSDGEYEGIQKLRGMKEVVKRIEKKML